MTSDLILLERYSKGSDAQAFAELVQRHAGLVVGVARRITGNLHDAEDIAQMCFLELAKRAGSVTVSLPAWLHRAARNRALNTVRDRAVRMKRQDELSKDTGSRILDPEWEQLSNVVDGCMDRVPDELRELLILHYLEGRSQTQIAESTGMSQPTVSRRLDEGVAVLRELLRKKEVEVTALSLAALLTANAIAAASPKLIAVLGKMAMTGVGTPAGATLSAGKVPALSTGGLGLKVAAGVAAVLIAAGGGAWWVLKTPAAAAPARAGAGLQESNRFINWHGDGAGRFPGATPPVTWSCRIDGSSIKELKCSGRKPGASGGGKANANEGIRGWLVAGPFAVEADPLSAVTNSEPDAGQKIGGLDWKEFTAAGSNSLLIGTGMYRVQSYHLDGLGAELDLAAVLPRDTGKVAYACTFIHSPDARAVDITLRYERKDAQLWVGGKAIPFQAYGDRLNQRLRIGLAQGWNRLLLRIPAAVKDSPKFVVWLFPAPPYKYEMKNIAWRTAMPAKGYASPVIAGNRIFVCAEPYELICVDKTDGRILWQKSNFYWETMTQKEKDSIRAEYEPAYEAWKKLSEEPQNKHDHRIGQAYSKLNGIMARVDKDKYTFANTGWGSAIATPVTDGKFVYVSFISGVTACYDLDGNRKWIVNCNFVNGRKQAVWNGEHGRAASPVLAGGKLIVHPNHMIALDAATGRVAWDNAEVIDRNHGSPAAVRLQGIDVVVANGGEIVRASDGVTLAKKSFPAQLDVTFNGCTPVTAEGMVYGPNGGNNGGCIYALKLAASGADGVTWSSAWVSKGRAQFGIAYYDGYLYGIVNNDLQIVNAGDGNVVHQRNLRPEIVFRDGIYDGHSAFTAPGAAGKRIYLLETRGSMRVFEAGKEGREIALNEIQNFRIFPYSFEWEQFLATPIFDGNCIYLRGDEYLYCISEKR